jgi:hypothetical protein
LSVTTASISIDDLIITLSDATDIIAGNVRGATGPGGPTGNQGATGVQGLTGDSTNTAIALLVTAVLGGTYFAAGSEPATPSTIAVRDSNGIIAGVASSAQYADLAEKYLADQEYNVGTVMTVGGEKEITAVTTSDCYVVGVVSGKPAYRMNEGLENGTFIALTGRVPVSVNMPVKKGDPIWPYMEGMGSNQSNGKQPFAFALENGGPGLVECLVK